MNKSRRNVERVLLAFVTVLLFCGLALVFAAKAQPSVTPPVTSATLNVNTATAPEFAHVLSISLPQATALVDYRDALPGHGFPSVYSVRNSAVLKHVTLDRQSSEFIVREPTQVVRQFSVYAALLIALFWVLHLVLRRWYPDADPMILPLVAFLAGVGLIMVFSVKDPYRDSFSFVTQARGVALFGLVAAAMPFTKTFKRLPLHRYGFAYGVASLVLMVLLLSPLGHGPAGAKVMALGFEPIEIIKVLLVFFVASYLAERRLSMQSQPLTKSKGLLEWRDLMPLGVLYLLVLFLFAVVKDLGPAVLLYMTFVTMIYLVTGRKFYPLVASVLLLVAGAAGYAMHFGFFATRVDMWLHPWDNGNRLGGQLGMGLWGLATGGIFGTGLGLGSPALVPRAGSDMVFASIGEELGLFGTMGVLIVYSVLVLRGFRIARNAVDDFDRLLAAGLTTLIGIQAVVITAGATGLAPLTGVTLPFVSYGSSSLVADFFSAGVLLWISSKRLPKDVPASVPRAYPAASRTVVTVIVGLLLLGVGLGRLMIVQGIDDVALATCPLTIPDADGVTRAHYNPRLVAIAHGIPRGRILDRNGKVLARDATGSEHGVSFLCGRPRIYPYGGVGASLVFAAEQPISRTNPLGRDYALSGLGDGRDLLAMYRGKDLPGATHLVGQDVHLSIDIELQRAAQTALDRIANQSGDGRGAVVALDCHTGEVLAAATTPTFDPSTLDAASWNALHNGSDDANPLLNRALAGLYPPGSTFKLVTATAALQSGHANYRAVCDHTVRNLHWRFGGHDYSRAVVTDEDGMAPHGDVGMGDALRVSCNVYYSQLALQVGAVNLERAMQTYDLGHGPTLATLAEDLPDCGYGQGQLLVTPLEMARVSQTIANGGQLETVKYKPSPSAATSTTTQSTVLSGSDDAQLGAMMRGVVTSGTASGVFDGLGVNVAGKTGSAQLSTGKTHSWFTGFAPYEKPQIAFACVIEHGGYGRTAAALVCREIVKAGVR